MTAGGAGQGPFRLVIRARMDRRRAETLALELRRRVKALGFDGVALTITPGTTRSGDGASPPQGQEESAAPSS